MMNRRHILFIVGVLLLLNVFAWKEVFNLAGNNCLLVDFLDVGQGDAAFLQTPQTHQIIIDGGPDLSLAKKLPEFMPFWDRSIDVIILTHPDKDHMAGLIEVLKRYKVSYFFWTGIKKSTPEYAEFLNAMYRAEKNGTKIITDVAQKQILLANAKIKIIYPFFNLSGKAADKENNTSIVSKIFFGKNVFIFTGDLEESGDKEMLVGQADVLKVAHHGSKNATSDEFLKQVLPKIAVISVGRNNNYGHPAPETLQKLENFGITVLRTDRDGDIKILSDGENIIVK